MAEKREIIITEEFRLSFPAIFEPRGYKNSEPKYSITMLFPKGSPALKPLKVAAYKMLVEKFGENKVKWPGILGRVDLNTYLSPTGKDGWPFRDGDLSNLDGYAGMVSVKATSKKMPGVVNRDPAKPIVDPDEVYAGCYCRASLITYYYKNEGEGVGFGLQNIQFLRDGEAFSGRSKAENDFTTVEEDAITDTGNDMFS